MIDWNAIYYRAPLHGVMQSVTDDIIVVGQTDTHTGPNSLLSTPQWRNKYHTITNNSLIPVHHCDRITGGLLVWFDTVTLYREGRSKERTFLLHTTNRHHHLYQRKSVKQTDTHIALPLY